VWILWQQQQGCDLLGQSQPEERRGNLHASFPKLDMDMLDMFGKEKITCRTFG
jgi:hypothetical protein